MALFPQAILRAPWSGLLIGPSMVGKTTLILDILSKMDNFSPRISHIHCFGNLNLKQFNVLTDRYGSDFVDINPVSKLPGFKFEKHSFVLVDEYNNAWLSLKRKEQEVLYRTVKKLFLEGCHHLELYFCLIIQDLIGTDCYKFARHAQSLMLGTKNGYSIEVVRQLRILSPDMKAKIISIVSMWSHLTMFILVYHIPSAEGGFMYHYIWSYLMSLPGFAIAIKAHSRAEPPKVRTKARVQLMSMAAQEELREVLENPVPTELSGEMYVFLPFESVKFDEEDIPPPAEDENEDPMEKLNKNMTEMFSHVCSAKDLGAFRKFWYYLQRIPSGTIGINEEGTLLYYDGRELSTLTFLKECTKRLPTHSFGHGKRRKVNKVTRDCVPFAAQLLNFSAFPEHLIQNQLLLKLARMYNE